MNGKTNLSKNMYSAFENDIKSITGGNGASRGYSAPLFFNPHIIYTREI